MEEEDSDFFVWKPTISDQRQLNQISLETFTCDKINVLDEAVDKLIQSQKTSFAGVKLRGKDLRGPNDHLNGEELHSNYQAINDFVLDLFYIGQEISVLFEVKIIYAFKFFKININTLMKAAYRLEAKKKFQNWETILIFFKEKILT